MDNINKWLTLAANIGVVFGLVFLGFEVRQNAEATRLEMIQTNRLTRIEEFRARRDSPSLAPIIVKLNNGVDLSEEEEIRYSNHIALRWAIEYFEWIQRDLNIGSEYIQANNAIRGLINNPRGLQIWEITGQIYPERFVRYVEEIISRENGDQ